MDTDLPLSDFSGLWYKKGFYIYFICEVIH